MFLSKYIYIGGGVIIICLALGLRWTYGELNSTKEELTKSNTLNTILTQRVDQQESQIKGYNQNDKEANDKIYLLRKELSAKNQALASKEDACNCYDLPIPDNVIRVLHGKTTDDHSTGKTNP